LIYVSKTVSQIESEHIPKLEEMLREKLKAKSVQFSPSDRFWIVKFAVDNSRKFYAFRKAVQNYGGKIIRWSLKKSDNQAVEAEDANEDV
jgi:hypothetical protein